MIAVDAMGGDFAPRSSVRGAYHAARKGIVIGLYGQRAILNAILNEIDPHWQKLPLTIVDCSQVIEMNEEPVRSISKKDSSLMRALVDVKAHHAHAVVSAGNSGSAVVGSIVTYGRVENLLRPALATFLPTLQGSVCVVDIGANVDCKPEYLYQFAHLGHTFVSLYKNIENPRIALISNGHEKGKGSAAIKKAYTLLEESSLNFIGNIESREIFNDHTDVIVCDGFVGNILLKSVQGTVSALTGWIKKSFTKNLVARLVGGLAYPYLSSLKQSIDYAKTGGALLLGVKYPLIVAHGCSNEVAFEQAIIMAHNLVIEKTVPRFNEALEGVLTVFPATINNSTVSHSSVSSL